LIPREIKYFKSILLLGERVEDDFWISLTDLGSAAIWYWDSTGSKVSFSNWDTDQPDNFGQEQCVQINAYSRTWDNVDCNDARKFVCEGVLPRA